MNLEKLLDQDAKLSKKLRVAEQPGLLRSIAAFLAHSGDSWVWLFALPWLLFFGNPYWQARALILILAILVTAVLVLTLKFTIRRRRPRAVPGRRPHRWSALPGRRCRPSSPRCLC